VDSPHSNRVIPQGSENRSSGQDYNIEGLRAPTGTDLPPFG